jgi:tetratricopeptide (TPR) repeat protein
MEHIAVYLRDIFFNGRGGQLVIKYGGIQKFLYFNKGELIFAKTNKPGERLGEILFKLGKISEEVFSKIDQFIEPRQNLGKVLLKKGLISERNLSDGLLYQFREITLSLFSVFNAEFIFQDKKGFSDEDLNLKITTPFLIEDGIRVMNFHPSIKSFLKDKVIVPAGKNFLNHMTEEERQLLIKFKASQTPAEMATVLNIDTDFYWKSLYLAYCLNLLSFQGEEAIREERKGKEPPVAETSGSLDDVIEMKEKLPAMNFYQILNVQKGASDDEVKKAYFHLARKFHPDRFERSLWTEHRQAIDEVFDQITKAYRTLSKPEDRTAYDQKIAAGGTKEEEKDVGKKAEIRFRQAKTLFNQGRFEEAVIFLEECIKYNKNKANYYLLAAMCEAKIPSFYKKAEQDFLKTQELEPWNAEAFVGLGILYKQEGLITKATRQFQKAVEIDAGHAIARKELGLLEKGQKKTGLKGILSMNIFGPKKK